MKRSTTLRINPLLRRAQISFGGENEGAICHIVTIFHVLVLDVGKMHAGAGLYYFLKILHGLVQTSR